MAPASEAVSVRRAGISRLDEVEPLWSSLYEHHAAIADGVAPVRDRQDSWRRRRAQYESWLASPGTVLLIAQRGRTPVGYAVVRVQPGPATWDVGELGAELETLAVLPHERGAGTGSLLIEHARMAARELGARRMAVAVAHTNHDALRFYRREGFAPFYVLLLDGPREGA